MLSTTTRFNPVRKLVGALAAAALAATLLLTAAGPAKADVVCGVPEWAQPVRLADGRINVRASTVGCFGNTYRMTLDLQRNGVVVATNVGSYLGAGAIGVLSPTGCVPGALYRGVVYLDALTGSPLRWVRQVAVRSLELRKC